MQQTQPGSGEITISPLGDRAVLLSLESKIDAAVNDRVLAIHHSLTSDGFPGFVESVPAYASLAVFYDPRKVERKLGEPVFHSIRNLLRRMIINDEVTNLPAASSLTIPVCYHPEFAPDINEVAIRCGLGIADVVALHISVNYRVYMIGFSPGFPYMGNVDPAIAIPRKEQPRIKVPAGSVGIAGSQTGIYPHDSPGGWQLIGRSPLKLFDPADPSPCLLRAGDRVTFVPIDKNEFTRTYAH